MIGEPEKDIASPAPFEFGLKLRGGRRLEQLREAATRVGIVIFASVFGMSFGGWISGFIFDATGSYAAAFMNGLGWNALNITIMVALLLRARQRLALA